MPDDKILLKLRRDAKIYMAQDQNAQIYLAWDRDDPGYIYIHTHVDDGLEFAALQAWFYRRKLSLMRYSDWSWRDVDLAEDFVLWPLSDEWNAFLRRQASRLVIRVENDQEDTRRMLQSLMHGGMQCHHQQHVCEHNQVVHVVVEQSRDASSRL